MVDNTGYGTRIYGELPEDLPMGDGRVFLILEKDGEPRIFEAFPIYEVKLLGGDGTNGFSAILSKDAELSGTYQLMVIAGGMMYHCNDITF